VDATLAAAQAFLAETDELVPAPDWLLLPARESDGGAPPDATTLDAANAQAAPRCAAPLDASFPPGSGGALRLHLAKREVCARRELEGVLQPAASLGRLSLGVLLPAPTAANVSAMSRAQLARLTEAPLFLDPRPRAQPGPLARTPTAEKRHVLTPVRLQTRAPGWANAMSLKPHPQQVAAPSPMVTPQSRVVAHAPPRFAAQPQAPASPDPRQLRGRGAQFALTDDEEFGVVSRSRRPGLGRLMGLDE